MDRFDIFRLIFLAECFIFTLDVSISGERNFFFIKIDIKRKVARIVAVLFLVVATFFNDSSTPPWYFSRSIFRGISH